MNFWRLIGVVKSRRWVILGIVAVTLLVIAIAARNPTEVYEAHAFMSPTPQAMQRAGNASQGTNPTGTPQDREVILSNLIILAESGDVYQKALDFLALPEDEQRKQAPDLPKNSYKQITRIETSSGKLLNYRDWNDVLDVAPVHNRAIGEKGTTTDIIRISIKMQNKEDVQYLANAVGVAFAQTFNDKSREDYRTYAKFLGSSEKEAKKKLQELQTKIDEHKQVNKVVVMDTEVQAAIRTLADLQVQQSQAESAVSEAEAAVSDINAQLSSQPLINRQNVPSDMNPNITKLRTELADAEMELRELARKYKPAHESYKAAQARVNMLRERIAKEGKLFAVSSVNEVHQQLLKERSEAMLTLAKSRASLNGINTAVARAQARVDELGQAEPQLTALMRDYTLAEKNYTSLSEKHSQILISERESTKTGSIVPFGWSRGYMGPIAQGPTRLSLLIYGFILSLIAGVMAAVWLESIDNRMRNASDVERLLELPVVGLTPQLSGRDGVLPKLTHIYPRSPMAESYKILRTNILFALRDSPFKTLMVATGKPGQGGTTIICNLAIALAQIGKRIILIDADMRRPSLHKFFDVPDVKGLSTLLQGGDELADVIQKTEVENLLVIPAGPEPTNPSELLGASRMREVVETLEAHCDLVLFDTPSTVVFSDGPMLASWIDAVLMVISANQVPRGTEARTRDLLKKANAHIIGVVVNRMSPDNVDSCYFYSHYYAESGPWSDGSSSSPEDQIRLSGSPRRSKSAPRQRRISSAPILKTEPKSKLRDEDEDRSPFPD